jgi:hypothetical protein
LQETVEKQARKTAERTSKNVAHSMALENQSLNNEGIEDFLKIQTEEILQKQLNKIWDRE